MEIINMNNNIEQNSTKLGENVASMYTGTLSANTKRAYLRDILDFFQVDDLTDISIEKIQNVDVSTANQFRERLMAEGKAPATVNRKLTSLSSFYRVLSRREIGLIEYNPFDTKEGNKRLKHSKRYSNTRCLTTEEVQKLVKAALAEHNPLIQVRNRIIILLLATTGVRREEIATIKIGHFAKNMGENVVEIFGKGDKERLVVISGSIMTLISKYLELRGLTWKDKEEYLITSHTTNAHYHDKKGVSSQTIYNVVKGIADNAGLDAESVSPHCLRHTFVTQALEMGIPIQDVADMSGHSDISTTRRYDHTQRVVKNSPANKLSDMFLEE